MAFDLTDTFDLLERTPGVLDGLLRGISADWHAIDEGPDTWSPIVVVGHLVYNEEANWVARARVIREHGEARAFDPFDRFAQFTKYGDWSMESLLDRFAELRRQNLETVRSWDLSAVDLALRGTHPDFSSVTLRQLLATWAVHDLTHISQIVRVMARRYDVEVGPWKQYLSILKPRG